MERYIVNDKELQGKSRTHEVSHIKDNLYRVKSGASGRKYWVSILPQGGARCTCEWGFSRQRRHRKRSGCSHVQAVYDYIEHGLETPRVVSAWCDQEQAERQHRPATFIGDNVILTSRKIDWK